MPRVLVVLAAVVGLPCVCLGQASFTPIARLYATEPLFAEGISADGSTVVGHSGHKIAFQVNQQPIVWRHGVTQLLPDLSFPNTPHGEINAASGDGSVLVGGGVWIGGYLHATRWENGRPILLPVAPGVPYRGSIARAVSNDGTIVAGFSFISTQPYVAHRWVGRVPEVLPGAPGIRHHLAVGMSSDGSVVAGWSIDDLNNAQRGIGWVWSNGETRVLSAPTGSTGTWTEAVSADGSTIVGEVLMNGWKGAVWQNGVLTLVEQRVGASPESFVRAVSPDGSIKIGDAQGNYLDVVAALWDAQNRFHDLNVVLRDLGVDLQGWSLRRAEGISADGRTITGVGYDSSGSWNSWVAVIPRRATWQAHRD